MTKITVINLAGEKEPFSFEKVRRSARRAGAGEEEAERIARRVEEEAYDGIETREIYGRVKSYLEEEAPKAALKFSVRQAMERLGPTGFPFERFAGEFWLHRGYKLRYDRMVSGRCSEYEIDFVAENEDEVVLAECKYRQRRGDKVDVNVALQSYARLLDIEKGEFKSDKEKSFILVTNEKFTSKAVSYADCVGMEMLGWRHPEGKGIEYFMDEKGLYPVTILPSFKKKFVSYFVERQKMLAKDVVEMNLPARMKGLKAEAELLLQ